MKENSFTHRYGWGGLIGCCDHAKLLPIAPAIGAHVVASAFTILAVDKPLQHLIQP